MNVDSINEDRYEAWTSFSGDNLTSKCDNRTQLDQRVETFFLNSAVVTDVVLASNVNSNVEGRVDISWGGREGTVVDYTVTTGIRDDHGNRADVSIHQNDRGEGGLSISGGAGSKEDSDKDNKSK